MCRSVSSGFAVKANNRPLRTLTQVPAKRLARIEGLRSVIIVLSFVKRHQTAGGVLIELAGPVPRKTNSRKCNI